MSDTDFSDPEAQASGQGSQGRENPRPVQAPPAVSTDHCPGVTVAGKPCRMRPTLTGYCLAHDPAGGDARKARQSRGGALTQARKRLAKAKADAIAQLGITEPLPTLDSVEACQSFVVQVAGRVLRREISPAQGNTLGNLVRLSKDLIGLAVDVRLAEMLDDHEGR